MPDLMTEIEEQCQTEHRWIVDGSPRVRLEFDGQVLVAARIEFGENGEQVAFFDPVTYDEIEVPAVFVEESV